MINIPGNTYSVTVTDANNCTATASVTITEPAAPLVATISGTNILCYGNSTGAVNLTVTGGTTAYTYIWTNGTVTEDLVSVPADIYSVTITDANGCTTSASITLTQPGAPLADTLIGTNVLCYGNNSGAISLTVTGGAGGYIFNWS